MVSVSTQGYEAMGVCLDTCHLFAAGYEFDTEAAMNELVEQFDATIGLENLQYIHLNDSKHPFGSEKDEHEHIGEGEIGEDSFEKFINHAAVRDLPMALETPDDDKGYAWNIEKVKSLYQ
jgi:deoxyribonuclease-4